VFIIRGSSSAILKKLSKKLQDFAVEMIKYIDGLIQKTRADPVTFQGYTVFSEEKKTQGEFFR
jgi:hypothetical protein